MLPRTLVDHKDTWIDKTRNFAKLFTNHVNLEELETEMIDWELMWTDEAAEDLPAKCKSTLTSCNSLQFPNLFKLLAIFFTLPVTTCTAERSFSTMRRLKTYLRSTMTSDRMSGLALMTIHREINPRNYLDEVLKIFINMHPRRLDFPNIFFDY